MNILYPPGGIILGYNRIRAFQVWDLPKYPIWSTPCSVYPHSLDLCRSVLMATSDLQTNIPHSGFQTHMFTWGWKSLWGVWETSWLNVLQTQFPVRLLHQPDTQTKLPSLPVDLFYLSPKKKPPRIWPPTAYCPTSRQPLTGACAVEHHLSCLSLPWCLQVVLLTDAGISSVLDDAQPASHQIWLPSHSPSSDDFLLYGLLHMSGMCLPQAFAIAVPSATQQPLYLLCSIWVASTRPIQPTFQLSA